VLVYFNHQLNSLKIDDLTLKIEIMYTEELAKELAENLDILSNGSVQYIVEFLLSNKDKTIEEMIEYTNYAVDMLINCIEE
jgi:hypothetical protein